jgi:uncharacterized protein (UPF0333 family)
MIVADESGQVSAELILLMACIIMVVISAISIYKDYLFDFTSEINNTELDSLLDKIDNIKFE